MSTAVLDSTQYVREDEARVTLTLEGVQFFDSWQTKQGGALTSTTSKTRPGSMGSEVDIGGPASRDDITLTIQWSDPVLAAYNAMEDMVGWGRAKVASNYLTRKRAARPGALFSRLGTLKSVSEPNYDTDGNVVGQCTVVIACDEKRA